MDRKHNDTSSFEGASYKIFPNAFLLLNLDLLELWTDKDLEMRKFRKYDAHCPRNRCKSIQHVMMPRMTWESGLWLDDKGKKGTTMAAD